MLLISIVVYSHKNAQSFCISGTYPSGLLQMRTSTAYINCLKPLAAPKVTRKTFYAHKSNSQGALQAEPDKSEDFASGWRCLQC